MRNTRQDRLLGTYAPAQGKSPLSRPFVISAHLRHRVAEKGVVGDRTQILEFTDASLVSLSTKPDVLLLQPPV